MNPADPAAHSPRDGDAWSDAHPLRDHLQSVAALARQAAKAFGAEEWAELAGLWHDLGKYRRSFQQYIRGTYIGDKSHQFAGAAWAMNALGKYPGALPIALAIAGHHGGLCAWTAGEKAVREKIGGSKELRAALPELLESLLSAPGDLLSARPTGIPNFFTRNRALGAQDQSIAWELLTRFLFSSLVDADWTDTRDFYEPELRPQRLARHHQMVGIIPLLRQRLDDHLDALAARSPDTPVNQHRRAVLAACRAGAEQPSGIFSLTVPTGGGKTLASLSFALRHAERHGLSRIIVVLPFTSIIEQNAGVLRAIFGNEHVLEHHSTVDVDELVAKQHGDPTVRHRHKLLSETWDAPMIITTAVQFLETLHHNHPSRLRKLHRVANSVVIMDECQTLPVPLFKPTLDTLRVLSRAFRVTLVACTATQPAIKTTMQDGIERLRLGTAITELIPDATPLFSALRRVTVSWPDLAKPTTWDALSAELRNESRVLAIVHLTKDARALAMLLDDDAFHLSARMVPAHRAAVLKVIRVRLNEPGASCRVVATNLVEAGVDLDFPVVYRALAGLDSLAQAAGRCNREGRLGPGGGSFRIFLPPDGSGPAKELRPALETTLALLREHDGSIDLDDPTIFPDFFRRLYGIRNLDREGIDALRGSNGEGKADGRFADFPEIATRYRLIDDQDRVAVIVPWAHASAEALAATARVRSGFAAADDLRRCQRLSVAVHRRVVGMWLADGSATASSRLPIPVLSDYGMSRLYHPRFGIDPTADTAPPTDILTA